MVSFHLLPSEKGAQELVVGVPGAFLVGGQGSALLPMRVASEVHNIGLQGNQRTFSPARTQGETNQEKRAKSFSSTHLYLGRSWALQQREDSDQQEHWSKKSTGILQRGMHSAATHLLFSMLLV
jgi:hypothetical protein